MRLRRLFDATQQGTQRIFRDLELVEHLGSGMPRILQAKP